MSGHLGYLLEALVDTCGEHLAERQRSAGNSGSTICSVGSAINHRRCMVIEDDDLIAAHNFRDN